MPQGEGERERARERKRGWREGEREKWIAEKEARHERVLHIRENKERGIGVVFLSLQ